MKIGGLAMNGKALPEMWNNMKEEGEKMYKEEEADEKKKHIEELGEVQEGPEGQGGGWPQRCGCLISFDCHFLCDYIILYS